MKTLLRIIIVLGSLSSTIAVAGSGIQVVGNSNAALKLKKHRTAIDIKGRASFHMLGTPSDLARGKLQAKKLNIVLKNIPQSMLTDRRAKQAKGGVGFHLSEPQALRYADGVAKGQLKGLVSFPQIRELSRPRYGRSGHEVYYEELPAVVDIEWATAPLELLTGCGPAPIVIEYRIGVRILPNPVTGNEEVISWTDQVVFGGTYGCLGETHVGREICVVPISIKDSATDSSPTGAGLPFGWPGVEEQWSKANVRFDLKPMQTIVDADLKSVTQAEMQDLIASFDVDDCVEIFFAETFIPGALFGGGVTFSSGMSEAKIVSSDANANDIDFTHLAHEMGHAMGLTHPGDGNPSAARPNVTDGSSGTLMCPSGFMNDNPDVNSEENADNLSNPLFKLQLRRGTPQTADCEDSPDCGGC